MTDEYKPEPPHPKRLTIMLSYHLARVALKLPPFQVKQITDTTYYVPTDWLTRDDVHAICMNPQWSVTVIDFDYLGHLTGMIGLAGAVGAKAAL